MFNIGGLIHEPEIINPEGSIAISGDSAAYP
jgi:hypothetical protein